jgi:putative RNA 2'-phosphotransferase
MKKDAKSVSKFLSLVLRHKPESVGIKLDKNGWAKVSQIKSKMGISQTVLDNVVNTNDKQRFAYSQDGTMIRANWGHSISIELNLEPVEPPDLLYHGTATRFMSPILAEGIDKRQRDHVHLSTDYETAEQVGSRHGKPHVFEVDAKQMHEDGVEFYFSTNVNIWLTDYVDPKYIKSDNDVTDIIESPMNFTDF